MQTVAALLKTMRPKQWTKNLLLFAALIFAKKIAEPASVLQALAAFVLFCALSGGGHMAQRGLAEPISPPEPGIEPSP